MAKSTSKTHAEYQRLVSDAIDKAVNPGTWGMPIANTIVSKEAQRFALCREAYNKSKKLYDASRAKLLAMEYVPPEMGKHVMADSPQVFLEAQVTAPRHTLSEEALRQIMMEEFDVDEQRAHDIIEFCKKPGDPVLKLQVTLKK